MRIAAQHCEIPFEHPIRTVPFSREEVRKLKKECTWMRRPCNAWSWHLGPNCGIYQMWQLRRCRATYDHYVEIEPE